MRFFLFLFFLLLSTFLLIFKSKKSYSIKYFLLIHVLLKWIYSFKQKFCFQSIKNQVTKIMKKKYSKWNFKKKNVSLGKNILNET